MSGATYRIEEYDRLSILYDDARGALVEARAILLAAGGRAGLTSGTNAASAVVEYLCEEIANYAPHSVKVSHGYCRVCGTARNFTEGKCDHCAAPRPQPVKA